MTANRTIDRWCSISGPPTNHAADPRSGFGLPMTPISSCSRRVCKRQEAISHFFAISDALSFLSDHSVSIVQNIYKQYFARKKFEDSRCLRILTVTASRLPMPSRTSIAFRFFDAA